MLNHAIRIVHLIIECLGTIICTVNLHVGLRLVLVPLRQIIHKLTSIARALPS